MKMLRILSVLPVVVCCSCSLLEEEPTLPTVTHDGRGSFGCLVNGKLFLPDAPSGFGTGIEATVQFSLDTVGVSIYAGNHKTNQTLVIFVYDSPSIQVGKVYDLGPTSDFFFEYTDYSRSISCHYDNQISGHITFLKFAISTQHPPLIAGTFELVSFSADCNDTVTITSGRFDV